jgi:hypothetical protein
LDAVSSSLQFSQDDLEQAAQNLKKAQAFQEYLRRVDAFYGAKPPPQKLQPAKSEEVNVEQDAKVAEPILQSEGAPVGEQDIFKNPMDRIAAVLPTRLPSVAPRRGLAQLRLNASARPLGDGTSSGAAGASDANSNVAQHAGTQARSDANALQLKEGGLERRSKWDWQSSRRYLRFRTVSFAVAMAAMVGGLGTVFGHGVVLSAMLKMQIVVASTIAGLLGGGAFLLRPTRETLE